MWEVMGYLFAFGSGLLLCYLANPREGDSFSVKRFDEVLKENDVIKVLAESDDGIYFYKLVNSSNKIVVFSGGFSESGPTFEPIIGKIYKFSLDSLNLLNP